MECNDPLSAGVESFNRQAYFDSHDLWEKVWIAEGRPADGFGKALVQAAVAMHHLSRGNLRGARKLYESCQRGLERFGPAHDGVDLTGFLAQIRDALERAEASGRFDPQSAPRMCRLG